MGTGKESKASAVGFKGLVDGKLHRKISHRFGIGWSWGIGKGIVVELCHCDWVVSEQIEIYNQMLEKVEAWRNFKTNILCLFSRF